jgi:uncharacterized protein YndB with AHSA1/START domain
MSRTIVEHVDLAVPADRAFRALSDPHELLQWWTDPALCASTEWEMDPRPGGRWRSRWRWTSDGTEFELGGEVLEVRAPHLLVVSWRDARYAGVSPTTVRYELRDVPGGCRLTVTHTGFDDGRPDHDDYAGGWSSVLAKLTQHVQGHSRAGIPGASR